MLCVQCLSFHGVRGAKSFSKVWRRPNAQMDRAISMICAGRPTLMKSTLGWVCRWMDVKASLRITYHIQQLGMPTLKIQIPRFAQNMLPKMFQLWPKKLPKKFKL